ncbi:hypothetical protein OH77DRAFT_1496819 [Trametes cingulata]|nr:hypothetical protein OH77DRAFT_1496819 [Trametes cingulata]
MLVLTPVPAHTTPYTYRARRPVTMYSEVDYFDAVAERAAQDYAAAQARLRAIEQQREQARRQQYLEEVARRQAALDDYYREQSRLIAASLRPSSYTPVGRTTSCAVEELSFSVRREEERRRVLLARQREAQRARALAEAQRREEIERRRQAHLATQRAKEEEAMLALLALTAVVSEDVEAAQKRPQRFAAPRQAVPSRASRNDVTEDDLRTAFEGFLSQFSAPSAPSTASKPVDVKGKGKAVDVPVEPQAPVAPSPARQQHVQVPSFKEELKARIRSETDPEVQESLVKLYSDIFDAPGHEPAQPVAGPSTPKRESKPPSVPSSPAPTTPAQPPVSESAKPTPTEGAPLHRTPALPPAVAEKLLKFYHARRARKLSLAQIKNVEDALRKLESTFEFPEHLDFVNPVSEADSADSDSGEPGALAYTANNTPVHAYEHALNGLLTQLDAVESNGDLAVRGRRKEVVREVERALEAVERRVEESRERSRERARRRSATVVAEVKPETTVPEADTVSFALVDTPSPVDTAPATPAPEVAPASESADVSGSAANLPSLAPASESATVNVVEAPEADTVSVELVDAPSAASESTDASSSEGAPHIDPSASPALSEPSPTEVHSSEELLQDEVVVRASEATSSPESSNETSVTAPSALPSVSVPTPEAITRTTSSATDSTYQTADADSATPSPTDAAPEPMTRAPWEAPSVAEETFLLSSTPLADAPKKSRPQQEDDELEIISKEEAAVDAKSDSEWSDVDAA